MQVVSHLFIHSGGTYVGISTWDDDKKLDLEAEFTGTKMRNGTVNLPLHVIKQRNPSTVTFTALTAGTKSRTKWGSDCRASRRKDYRVHIIVSE